MTSVVLTGTNHGLGTYDLLTNLDLFAFGALLAYFLFEKGDAFGRFVNGIRPVVKTGYVLLVVALVFTVPHIGNYAENSVLTVLSPAILGLFFAGLLALFVPKDSTFRIGERNVLNRLGRYTYGLYVWHTVVLNLVTQIYRRLGWSLEDAWIAGSFFLLSLVASVLDSMASYFAIERPFLRLKRLFY